MLFLTTFRVIFSASIRGNWQSSLLPRKFQLQKPGTGKSTTGRESQPPPPKKVACKAAPLLGRWEALPDLKGAYKAVKAKKLFTTN